MGPFPNSIYTILVIDQNEEEKPRGGKHTPISRVFSLGLVFLRFLVLLDLELIFGAELEDPAARGYHVVVELSFGRD